MPLLPLYAFMALYRDNFSFLLLPYGSLPIWVSSPIVSGFCLKRCSVMVPYWMNISECLNICYISSVKLLQIPSFMYLDQWWTIAGPQAWSGSTAVTFHILSLRKTVLTLCIFYVSLSFQRNLISGTVKIRLRERTLVRTASVIHSILWSLNSL